jgi:transcriptional regulator with XRE-family HTH domain
MAVQPSPTVRRRRLAIELRRLREEAGLTIERVADALECSDSKISRIETAQVAASPRDVRDMLDLYGMSGERRDELVQVAREARQKGWWHAYRDVEFVGSYIGLEAAASSIRIYEALLIPGLLQTRQYAGAILRALRPDLPPEQLERRVELRVARQAILVQDEPPAFWGILDEAVVRRTIGGRQLMREQLQRLVETAEAPNVTLQILPFAAGEHAGLDGTFTILSFPEPADPDVVHVEHITSELYLERADELYRYALAFDHLRATALKPSDSIGFLKKIASEL